MRISDWSSDVCSSDLSIMSHVRTSMEKNGCRGSRRRGSVGRSGSTTKFHSRGAILSDSCAPEDRKCVVEGKSVSARVDIGGLRNIKKTNIKEYARTSSRHIYRMTSTPPTRTTP